MRILCIALMLAVNSVVYADNMQTAAEYADLCKSLVRYGNNSRVNITSNLTCLYYTKGVLSGMRTGFINGYAKGYMNNFLDLAEESGIQVDNKDKANLVLQSLNKAQELDNNQESLSFCTSHIGIDRYSDLIRDAVSYIEDNPQVADWTPAAAMQDAWVEKYPLSKCK